MPNWVTTELIAPDEVLHKYMSTSYINEDGEEVDHAPFFDFQKVIPQPENIERGACGGEHEDGVVCWYRWNIDNWGTKWDAKMLDISEGCIRFDTAWSVAEPIVAEVSRQNPEHVIVARYADEDLGYNCGTLYYLAGTKKAHLEPVVSGSIDALEFAVELSYGMPFLEWAEDRFDSEIDDLVGWFASEDFKGSRSHEIFKVFGEGVYNEILQKYPQLLEKFPEEFKEHWNSAPRLEQ